VTHDYEGKIPDSAIECSSQAGACMMNIPIRVLIVDDSALVRKLLTQILQSDPAIEVVGTATDPYAARQKIKKLEPDVLTLDVAMPKMDGITFLSHLMRLHPMPVLMLSTLTTKGADIAMQALELGAIDFVSKPSADLNHQLAQYSEEIISKIKAAATARVRAYSDMPATQWRQGENSGDPTVPTQFLDAKSCAATEKIIAIGASTGGTEAIKELLAKLPISSPGAVITQHIPAAFSARFAETANRISAMKVCQAQDGQQILCGHAYIAPGDKHLEVVRDQTGYHCKLSDDAPVNRHKPSVDVMFQSVSQCAGPNAIGVLLTGMGKDGARGLKKMQQAGALTIAQDEASSLIWGMPGAAVALKAADMVVPLAGISNVLITHKLPHSGLNADIKNHSK
jgi:two-component system chemotaxis response regulator CheB